MKAILSLSIRTERLLLAVLVFLAIGWTNPACFAQSSLRAGGSKGEGVHLIYYPVGSQEDKSFHLVFPPQYREIATRMEVELELEYQALQAAFGAQEGFRAQVQLMEAFDFYRKMKVPKWTNAIYLHSRIIIPIKTTELSYREELRRAIRHELVHAFIDNSSQGKCPGWLDEGLAQLLEGPEHPVLRAALQKWVRNNGAIPFKHLKSGFTKLPSKMVPAAYAQSLYAVKYLLANKNPEALQKLFLEIRSGETFSAAFRETFGRSVPAFEQELRGQLRTLSRSTSRDTNSVWLVSYDSFVGNSASGSQKASLSLERKN